MKSISLIIMICCGLFPINNGYAGDNNKILNMALFWLDDNVEPTQGWNGWTLTRCGIGENLIQIDENMQFKPVIAKAYKVVDDKTSVFEIRDDIKFNNGNIVDALACKLSIERALKVTDRKDKKLPVESITAEGQTLTLKTTKPYATLLNNLADPVFIIVDTTVSDEIKFKYQPVTTGPFKIIEFIKDRGLTLEKNEHYWKGEVDVDKINVKYIQDGTTRFMALQSGEIDLATQISARNLKILENETEFKVLKGPNLRVFMLRVNMTRPYMKELKFRKALAYGIDKEVYAEKIVHGIRAQGPFTGLLPFGSHAPFAYEYNPQKANELLDELGYMDTNGNGVRECEGKDIVVKFVSSVNHGIDARSIGVAMQSQYKDIGLGVEIVQVDNYNRIARSGDFDLLWERWTSAPTLDPQYFIESGFETGATGNYGKYSNRALDAVCSELRETMSVTKRNELGITGANILRHDVAALFLYYQEGSVVVRNNIDGVYRFVSELYYIDDRLKLVK